MSFFWIFTQENLWAAAAAEKKKKPCTFISAGLHVIYKPFFFFLWFYMKQAPWLSACCKSTVCVLGLLSVGFAVFMQQPHWSGRDEWRVLRRTAGTNRSSVHCCTQQHRKENLEKKKKTSSTQGQAALTHALLLWRCWNTNAHAKHTRRTESNLAEL